MTWSAELQECFFTRAAMDASKCIPVDASQTQKMTDLIRCVQAWVPPEAHEDDASFDPLNANVRQLDGSAENEK